MKLFDKAVWKLTGIYTAILVVVSVGFSVACYFAADHELNQPLRSRPDYIITNEMSGNFHILMKQRDDVIRTNFLAQLLFINFGIMVAGAVISYFLARRTLRPINEAMEKQSRFVSDASHELRTPLAAMAMENEVLLRDKTAGKTVLAGQIKSNLEEIGRLQKLTDYLLKFDKNQKLQLVEADLNSVSDEVIKKFTEMAKAKKIQLVKKIGDGKMRGDEAALGNILSILIDNATKYSPAGTKITIGFKNGQLSVRDQGPGIAADDLPHIFERFYRAEKSRTTDGYGLGLSLAENLARKINLKISVRNNKTGGATFYVQ
ncbi:MAG: HAMP domain-containing histidine kinase [Candidatus Nomurabacteria bacterium]|nr:HAMP domain-containing histidine kinase [Candidatus Nomurabacteria bacterium]